MGPNRLLPLSSPSAWRCPAVPSSTVAGRHGALAPRACALQRGVCPVPLHAHRRRLFGWSQLRGSRSGVRPTQPSANDQSPSTCRRQCPNTQNSRSSYGELTARIAMGFGGGGGGLAQGHGVGRFAGGEKITHVNKDASLIVQLNKDTTWGGGGGGRKVHWPGETEFSDRNTQSSGAQGNPKPHLRAAAPPLSPCEWHPRPAPLCALPVACAVRQPGARCRVAHTRAHTIKFGRSWRFRNPVTFTNHQFWNRGSCSPVLYPRRARQCAPFPHRSWSQYSGCNAGWCWSDSSWC